MKSAVLFYNDGQVKFTHRVVGPHQWLYRETEFTDAPIAVGEEIPVKVTVNERAFSKIGESSHYILFGESH